MTTDIKVPDIGDFDAVEVIEVLAAAGDTVDVEQPLITLESDKATLEVPTTVAGTVVEMKVGEGDKVAEGDVIAVLEEQGSGGERDSGPGTRDSGEEAATEAPAASTDPSSQANTEATSPRTQAPNADTGSSPESRVPSPDQQPASSDQQAAKPGQQPHASPSVRKYARELGVDLTRVSGTGRKGRIQFEDVQGFVKKALDQGGGAAATGGAGLPPQPDIDYSQFGEVETVELPRIRKISAQTVHNNWLLIPQVTQFDQADITELESFRKTNKEAAANEGVKLTPLAFLLKASAAALKTFPDLNSSLTADCEHLVHKHYCHIGVAVDTPNGLLMPVIRDVDQKGVYQLARDLDDVSSRAREGKLGGDEMKGASFSISSLGGIGGTAFTPIVNSPQVAMLGVSRHDWQPVWNGSEFEPRLMLPLSLSYDHRVIDGAAAARITGYLGNVLGDIRKLLL